MGSLRPVSQYREIPPQNALTKSDKARAALRQAVWEASQHMTGPQIESFVRSINNEIERDKV